MTAMTERDIALLKIINMGHPTLRLAADSIPPTAFGTPELHEFSARLIATMIDAEGVGLAAPQVGESLRAFAYYVPSDREYPDGIEEDFGDEEELLVPPTVLINPQFKPLSNHKVEDWEGCLSIPGIRGLVPRYTHIKVEAVDPDGNPIHFEAEDFHARVIQHEYDHLDGVLFLDRMEHMRSLAFEEEWAQYVLGYDLDEIGAD